MANNTFIAIDLGAESGRVMRATVGETLHLEEAHRFGNGPVLAGNTLYWDILGLWREITNGLRQCAAHGAVASIGVDTWGVDFALVGKQGQLVGSPVHYRDARTEGMQEKFFAILPRETVYGITGLQTLNLNTLFQLFALRQTQPELLAAAHKVLFVPDLINYYLCGRMANEYTIASTSQMFDARRRDWSPEILKALGVPRELFPETIAPGRPDSVLGVTRETLAMPGIPVTAIGSHDTASAVAAVPAQGDDWLFLSSGTWSLLGVEVPQPVLTAVAQRYNLTNEGGVGGRIRLLRNIAGLWLLQECFREWTSRGADITYAQLADEARAARPNVAQLDPDDGEFYAPGHMTEKIIGYCRRTRQAAPQTRGEFSRVILESLAAAYARVKRMLEEATGRKFSRLHIVGGGSRNTLLNQLAADATGLTVLAGPVEATAMGNIMTQALAVGLVKNLDEARRIVARSVEVKEYTPCG